MQRRVARVDLARQQLDLNADGQQPGSAVAPDGSGRPIGADAQAAVDDRAVSSVADGDSGRGV